jgi:cytoskeletal protein CcmA (bactofilin family)
MAFRSKGKQEKQEQESFTAPSRPTYKPQPQPEPPRSGAGSFIGRTMNIKADITSDEDVTVEGRVKGNIIVSKTLTIGKSGNVSADMEAAVVRIIGIAKGNIIASDKVEILSQGRYTGNIQSQKLVVAEGAVLNGHINQEQKKKK